MTQPHHFAGLTRQPNPGKDAGTVPGVSDIAEVLARCPERRSAGSSRSTLLIEGDAANRQDEDGHSPDAGRRASWWRQALVGVFVAAVMVAWPVASATAGSPSPVDRSGLRTLASIGAREASASARLGPATWSDEFDGASLDLARWSYRATGSRHDGILTPDAVSVGDGALTIKTYTEEGTHYSGMISTHEHAAGGFEQAYGYFEARVKFNSTPGQWSAFWLQSPTIGSPLGDPATAGVEIDIAEARARCGTASAAPAPQTCSPANDISDRIQQALIWDGYGAERKAAVKLSDPLTGLGNDSWHTWALRWTPTDLTFYYDNVPTWSSTGPISRRAQYIILSSEVGAFFAGAIPASGYGSRQTSTTSLQVDYVRVWNPAPQNSATVAVNTAAPTISGTGKVGRTLACAPGSWSGSPAPRLSYEWVRDGAPISGASATGYTVHDTDRSHALSCRVSATNTAGVTSAVSNALFIAPRALADRTAPNAKLLGHTRQRLRATIVVTILCPDEACRATAMGIIRIPKHGRARAKTYKPMTIMTVIAKGTKVKVRLKLTGRARSAIRPALRARKRIVLKLGVRVADNAHNIRPLSRQVMLRL